MVPKLVAPSYDNVEVDPHLYDDDISETLNDEQPPMDYTEFKRTVVRHNAITTVVLRLKRVRLFRELQGTCQVVVCQLWCLLARLQSII